MMNYREKKAIPRATQYISKRCHFVKIIDRILSIFTPVAQGTLYANLWLVDPVRIERK